MSQQLECRLPAASFSYATRPRFGSSLTLRFGAGVVAWAARHVGITSAFTIRGEARPIFCIFGDMDFVATASCRRYLPTADAESDRGTGQLVRRSHG